MKPNKRIKVLFTIPNFVTAGSQYVVLSLYKRINRDIFDPYICVEKFPEAIPNIVPKDRRLIFDFEKGNLKKLWLFRNLLIKENISIVHSWDYKSNFYEAFATRFAKVNYIYTKKNNAWSRRWWLKTLLSTHISYNNPEMKDRFFNSFLIRGKITFIPHGVDTEVFQQSDKAPAEYFNIGCIGNIGVNKNQLFIVKALKKLPENMILHLYGKEDKEYRQRLNQYIELNTLNHRVVFHGFIANESIPNVLKNLDLFVLASFQEGLPVSILEALACGVPVLSSDSGGGAEYILKEKGIFSLDDGFELIDKIKNVYAMDDSKRKLLVEEGVQNVKLNFSIDREVMAYEQLYKKILGK